MKNIFNFLSTTILLSYCFTTLAQEGEEILYNIPALGDTLNKEERDFYNLFPNIKDFEYAVFYIDKNEVIDATVYSLVKDKLEHHTYNNYLSGLNNINHYLEQVDRVSASTPGGKEVTVYLLNDNVITGELISVRQNSILVFPVQGGINLIDDSDLITSIKLQDINEIETPNTRNFLSNCLLSYFTGGVLGAGITAIFTNKNDQLAYGLALTIGAFVGMIVSYLIFSNDIDEYEVNADFDLNDIRKYARFKSFEPMYLKQIERGEK